MTSLTEMEDYRRQHGLYKLEHVEELVFENKVMAHAFGILAEQGFPVGQMVENSKQAVVKALAEAAAEEPSSLSS